MKEKIFIYVPYTGGFYDKYLINLVNALTYNEIIIGSPHNMNLVLAKKAKFMHIENLNYWSKANDYKELYFLLHLLINMNVRRLHILRYSYENLFSIMSNFPGIEEFSISIGVFGFREIIETKARENLFFNLVKSKSIKSVLVHSISKNIIPNELIEYRDSPKVHFVSDPIYDNVNDYNFINKIDSNIKLLYFGSFFYSKGVDLLLDAANKLENQNHHLTIAGNMKTMNFDFSNFASTNKYTLIDKYLSEEEVIRLLEENNVLVLPYRNTYENGTSGVLVQAALSAKLIVVPNIFPFNEVVNKFSLGITFEAGSSDSLAKSIDEIIVNYSILYSKAKFKDYIKSISSWDEISSFI